MARPLGTKRVFWLAACVLAGSLMIALGARPLLVKRPADRVGAEQWPEPLSADRVEARLRERCRQAGGAPLLVEFSAPWCDNCGAVKSSLRDPELHAQLEAVESVSFNIGEGRELDGLRRELGARAIPYWTIVRAPDCSAPLSEWTRVAERHPTGDARASSAWLERFGDAS